VHHPLSASARIGWAGLLFAGALALTAGLSCVSLRGASEASQVIEKEANEAEARADWPRAHRLWAERLACVPDGDDHLTERGEIAARLAQAASTAGDLAASAEAWFIRLAQLERDFGPDAPELINPLFRCATQCAWGRHSDRVLPMAARALAIAEARVDPNSPDWVKYLDQAAWIHMMMSDAEAAEPLLNRAVALGRRIAPAADRALAGVLSNLGWCYYKAHADCTRALPLLRESLEVTLRVAGRDSLAHAFVLNRIAAVLASDGLVHDAIDAAVEYNRIIELRAARNTGWLADGLKNLGTYEMVLGRLAEAEQHIQEALTIYAERFAKSYPSTTNCRLRLADIAWQIGDDERAETLWRLVHELALQADPADPNNAAIACLRLSRLADKRSLGEEATAWLARAEALGQEHELAGGTQWAIAAGRMVDDLRHARYEEVIARSASLREEYAAKGSSGSAEYAALLQMQAEAELGLGAPDKALVSIHRARALVDGARLESSLTLRILALHARVLGALGRRVQALETAAILERAEVRWMRRVLAFTSEAQRLRAQQEAVAIDVLASLGDPAGLAAAVLRRKGVVLDAMIEDERLLQAHPESRVLFERIRASSEGWRGHETGGELGHDPTPRDLERAIQVQDEAERALARSAAGFGVPRAALDVDVSDVVRALAEHQCLAEFFAWRAPGRANENRLGVVVIGAAGVVGWADLGPLEGASGDVVRLEAMARAGGALAGVSEAARRVRERLFDPWQAMLPAQVHEVIVAPEGPVCFVPFAALPAAAGGRLGDRLAFASVSSGRDLLDDVAPPSAPSLLAFADPVFGDNGLELASLDASAEPLDFSRGVALHALPGARAETARLSELFAAVGTPMQILVGDAARESALPSGGKAPSMLHFATHGIFLPRPAPGLANRRHVLDNPMDRSAIALAGARTTFGLWDRGTFSIGDDGVLTAREVGSLDLRNTWLCVLSACESAAGDVAMGDGVLGLRRGFSHAGVAHLISALWPVSDRESAAFMEAFYRRVLAGASPPDALNATQRAWFARLDAAGQPDRATVVVGGWIATFRGRWHARGIGHALPPISAGTPR